MKFKPVNSWEEVIHNFTSLCRQISKETIQCFCFWPQLGGICDPQLGYVWTYGQASHICSLNFSFIASSVLKKNFFFLGKVTCSLASTLDNRPRIFKQPDWPVESEVHKTIWDFTCKFLNKNNNMWFFCMKLRPCFRSTHGQLVSVGHFLALQ